jgi:hypothetical protein
MRPVLRDFSYSLCLLAIALVFALVCQSPFVQASSANAPGQAQLQQPGR